MNHRRYQASNLVCALLAAAVSAIVAVSPVAAEPSPPSGTIGPGDPPLSWTGGNISGTCNLGLGEACCVENVICETFTLTLRAGDYAGELTIEIRWPSPTDPAAIDYDLYVHEGDLNGPLVASGEVSGVPSETVTIHLDPGPQPERVFAIHIKAAAVPPGSSYSGSASVGPPTLNVEIDWLKADGHNHRPSECELDAVVAAFAAKGHTLNYELSDEIPEDDSNQVIDFIFGVQDFDTATGDWANLESVYRDRGAGWHYCIFGHNYSVDGTFTPSSGIAEILGDEFLVSLGMRNGPVGNPMDRSGTFMHEFGHNLSLRHAGSQDEGTVAQRKPNFPSVMAYRYQRIGVKTGLICQGLADSVAAAGFKELDYSSGTLASLDENALCESDGLGLGTGVDWSCSEGISSCESLVAKDLSSSDDWCTNDSTRSVLTDYNDWANIVDVAGNSEVMSAPQEIVSCFTDEDAAGLDDVLACVPPDPCATTGVVDAGRAPTRMLWAWPNPSRGPTQIHFELSKPGSVEFQMFDPLGRRVDGIPARVREAGAGRVEWSGTTAAGVRLSSGIYFVRMLVDGRQTASTTVLRLQ